MLGSRGKFMKVKWGHFHKVAVLAVPPSLLSSLSEPSKISSLKNKWEAGNTGQVQSLQKQKASHPKRPFSESREVCGKLSL